MKFTGEMLHVIKLLDANTYDTVGIMMVEQGEEIDLTELALSFNAPKGKKPDGFFADSGCITPLETPFTVMTDSEIYIHFEKS
jgi:hypothetical protein